MIILIFVYVYVSVVTFFLIYGSYKLFRQYLKATPPVIVKTRVVQQRIPLKEIKKQQKARKELRDSSYDAVYRKCIETAKNSEVVYFSIDDINGIVNELKKEQLK